jgi:hypothetical protein
MKRLFLLVFLISSIGWGQQSKTFDTIKVKSVVFRGDLTTQTTAGGASGIVTGDAVEDSLNVKERSMTKRWNFADVARFDGGAKINFVNNILWTNADSTISGIPIPTTLQLLGGEGDDPLFYHLVGVGGAAVTSSNDTIYIEASGGGEAGTISAIQNVDGSITVVNPTGATTTIKRY